MTTTYCPECGADPCECDLVAECLYMRHGGEDEVGTLRATITSLRTQLAQAEAERDIMKAVLRGPALEFEIDLEGPPDYTELLHFYIDITTQARKALKKGGDQ